MQKLIVTRLYQDVNGVKIRPDTYDANDLRLAGMAEWLVQSGFAEWQEAEFQDESETGAIPYSVGIDIGASGDTTTFSIVSASAEGIVVDSIKLSNEHELDEINDLRKRYTELSGKKVYNGWDEATLRDKIAELEERES